MEVSGDDAPAQGAKAAFDAVQQARALPEDQRTKGSELFVNAGSIFESIRPALEAGDTKDDGYFAALSALINTVTDTAALAKPPSAALRAGLAKAGDTISAEAHIQGRVKALQFRHSTGIDMLMWAKPPPAAILMQQAAFGVAAVADAPGAGGVRREIVADLLEEVFRNISDKKTVGQYKEALHDWDIDMKHLQFCLMRVLCLLYAQLVAADRTQNMRFMFRHAEAADIMIVLYPQRYAGFVEQAWCLQQKIVLGLMHVTDQMWEQARASAGRGAAMAATLDHDFVFVPAAYNLLFFLAVGCKGKSFDLPEVKKLISDIERSEARLDAWGIKEHVLFECQAKRWLIALRAEWAKHTGEGKGKGEAKSKKKQQQAKKKRVTMEDVLKEDDVELPEGHIPVTDWRVLDQRFYGFYVWLEPPLQKDEIKCAQCERLLIRVHRCTTCKRIAYCSAMCAQAHLFDHDCEEAPRPWLSPPVGPTVKPPDELGEEGFLGFIPWHMIKYIVLVGTAWAGIYGWRAFDDFRFDQGLSVPEALIVLFHRFWHLLRDRIEWRLGLAASAPAEPPSSHEVRDHMLPAGDERDAISEFEDAMADAY